MVYNVSHCGEGDVKIPGISTIRNLSLRSKMVAGGILILMVPVMIIGSVTFIKSYSATENIAKTQFMQIAGTISGMISIALQKDLKVVNGIASNPVVIDEMSRGAYTEGGKIIAGIYQMLATDYESIAIFDTDGIIRANAATGRSIGIGIADRAYFIAAREGRASVDTMVFSKATGNPIFGICAPVKAGSGKFMGGVLGVVKADYLMRYISSIKLGTTGYAFILDRSGTIIVHPEESLILNRTIFMDPGLKGISGKMMGLSAGTEEYIFRGSKKIAGFTPVDFVGWSVAVTQNKSEIMSLVYSNTGFIIMICGIFVVLTVIAVFYLSGTISIPVQTTLATLRQAIEQASEAFVIVGLDRRVQYANPASLAMSGQPMEEFRTSPSDFAGLPRKRPWRYGRRLKTERSGTAG